MISGRQIREARLMLSWSGEEFRTRANVADDVRTRAEAVDGTPSITLHQAGLIQQAFERAGIRFGRNGAVMMTAKGEG